MCRLHKSNNCLQNTTMHNDAAMCTWAKKKSRYIYIYIYKWVSEWKQRKRKITQKKYAHTHNIARKTKTSIKPSCCLLAIFCNRVTHCFSFFPSSRNINVYKRKTWHGFYILNQTDRNCHSKNNVKQKKTMSFTSFLTHTYTVRTGDLRASMIGEKCKISFPSFDVRRAIPFYRRTLKNERTNDRFIKTFPSLDGIDEYESNTSNKYDMLFFYVLATYMLRHIKRCGIDVSMHTRNEKSVKEDVSKRSKRRESSWKKTLVLLFLSECQVIYFAILSHISIYSAGEKRKERDRHRERGRERERSNEYTTSNFSSKTELLL